ncbi:spheroidene monooxygenase [Albimonas pacifica]|uniref:spheroidene monooxygenase n=1 Tax=Albimonas pacifica TaxID=1114924 RepID=UPI003CCB9B7C
MREATVNAKRQIPTGEGNGPIAVVSLSLYRFASPAARAWAVAQMGLARPALARAPGIGFRKLLGSGVGEGFTPRPNWAVWAILAEWPDAERARAAAAGDRPLCAWRARAEESLDLFLAPLSRRGRWSGAAPFEPAPPAAAEAPPGPIAALTRATLRPAALLRFWGREPAISAAIGANPDVLLKIGLGETPWLQQVTFSIWPDAAAMDRFARGGGPHAGAIAAARRNGWFAEELYARFAVIGRAGAWQGRDPLPGLPSVAARQGETA